MTMKGVRSTRNLDPRMKKVILDKRIEALFKQANELSILCDIEVGVIVFGPGENNAFVWPSVAQASDRVKNYLASIETAKVKKLSTHVDELEKIVDARIKRVYEKEQMVKRKEMEKLFNDLVEAKIQFNELDTTETRGLLNLFDTKKIQLNERKRQQSENV
ncbi:MADS-box transcription factor 47-like [Solanum pennellii]|uniref:MADS-box transcription factor 47-like n=1 Tax=Solanum pennellii TaxID=28526 RepID=A0ABM1FQ50_SOLPN|nr:MADS-box transcription factor 47-like [Solanum pennellii]